MPLTPVELLELFDAVMRLPESVRGLDVPETCRLLAEAVRARVPAEEYTATMRAVEELYLDQFLNTCSADPTFAARVKRSIARFV